MTTTLKVSASLILLTLLVSATIQTQGSGKPMTMRGTIVAAAEVKDDGQKKAGLLGWLSFKDGGSGLRVFVRAKTKLEKQVGKDRQRATFADLKPGTLVELIHSQHDGQPSMGPTLSDAQAIVILPAPK
ncbi:MAG: hypothetical protein FJ303_22890 [Planctomycetes bacterium]|nr:hypothetical protein [Planctomycetota bacterium]